MLTVAIVEDELLTAHFLRETLEKYECRVAGVATNLQQGRELLGSKVDLFFLDIRLADEDTENEDGLIFARELAKVGCPFIFITGNSDEHTTNRAAATEPMGYLTKPFNSKDILATLSIVRFKINQANQSVSIPGLFGKKTIQINDICYIEANSSYVTIFCTNSKFTQRITLKLFLEQISNPLMVRIHRSYAVNRKFVQEVSASRVLCAGRLIPVSTTYKDNLQSLKN
jgi:two-component system, response regulator PdtaR